MGGGGGFGMMGGAMGGNRPMMGQGGGFGGQPSMMGGQQGMMGGGGMAAQPMMGQGFMTSQNTMGGSGSAGMGQQSKPNLSSQDINDLLS